MRSDFPLIIKAAFGGGGRGMRVVEKPSQLPSLLAEGPTRHSMPSAIPPSSSNATFPAPNTSRSKSSATNTATSSTSTNAIARCNAAIRKSSKSRPRCTSTRGPQELCDAAVALAKGIGYNNAGTVEFLYDMDRNDWFFIEMNPRIQVEHTVTECVTGIDLVRSQILIAGGEPLFGEEVAIPQQENIPCNGFAIQCRVTTEDPEKISRPTTAAFSTTARPPASASASTPHPAMPARSSRPTMTRCW
jgi:pyruvate carboxylase